MCIFSGQYTFHSCNNTAEHNSSEYFTPNETIQSKSSPPLSPRHDMILEIANSRKTIDNLDNIHQTLVENTTYLSSDSENEINLHSTIEEVSEENSSSSVIVITDESFNESLTASKYEPYQPCVKQELMSRIDDYNNSLLSPQYSFHELQKSTLLEEIENHPNKNNLCSLTTGLDRLNISNSSTKSDPYEASTSSSFNFNDTLEEMEMALKQGLDYVMPNDLSTEPSPEKISPSPVTKTIHKTPTNKYNYLRSPVGDYINSKSINNNFKLPTKPPKNRAITPKTKSPQIQPRLFKNIISPISIYIKNSPRVCLKQNIQAPPHKASHIIKNESVPLNSNNKQNTPRPLPKMVYKPPKQVIINSNQNIILPGNIKKLLPKPIVMGHQQRIRNNDDNTSISRKLLEDDITFASFDASQSAVDVSILESKQAFIK